MQIPMAEPPTEDARQAYDDLTVILPTLNEEKSVPVLLRRLGELYPGARVIVADDDSQDRTRHEALAYRGPLHVEVIHRQAPETRGLTASVVEAISTVKTPVFVVMDADLQHPPEAVQALYAAASNGSHLAVGRRVDYHHLTGARRALSLSARALTRTYLRTRRRPLVEDPMSGFFGAKAEYARQILRKHANEFEGRGFKVLVDFLRFSPAGTHVHEIPYEFGRRDEGESKLAFAHVVVLLRQLGPLGRAAAGILSTFLSPYVWRFAVVGLSGVLVNTALLALLHGVGNVPLLVASPLAIAGAICWNFTWNDAWTFGQRRRSRSWLRRLARFASHCAFGAALNVAALALLAGVFDVHYAIANLAGIGLATAWNWAFATNWTWAEPQRIGAAQAGWDAPGP